MPVRLVLYIAVEKTFNAGRIKGYSLYFANF